MKKQLRSIPTAFSEVFFLSQPIFGILIIGMTLINPIVAVSGIISTVSAYLLARLINMEETFIRMGFYIYNPLLVGMSIGFLFKISPPTIMLAAIAGMLTFICTMVLANLFYFYFKLPVLSLPFVIISTIVYLASIKYSHWVVTERVMMDSLSPDLPYWLSGYFKSLGAIFFSPQVAVGIVIAICILAGSRILFMLSLIGYYGGSAFTALMLGTFHQAFNDVNQFNVILVAMGLGGVFLIPSLKSYLLTFAAIGVSTLFYHAAQSFWWNSNIPVFTLPFNVTVLIFIYVLGISKYHHLTQIIKPTPEETLEGYLLNQFRINYGDISIMLPYSGKWTVWQGNDGQWTHQGNWKYAYDFIVTDSAGNSFRNNGNQPCDYYTYGKPVLSPINGKVVKTVSHLPDCPVGQPDKMNNWGNLVIIQDPRGFFVEISHFSPNSIRVKEGDEVQLGTFLGKCGNSGYANVPHIHIQVQLIATIGAYTIPFTFANYSVNNTFYTHGLPEEGTEVESLLWNPTRRSPTKAFVGELHHFQVMKEKKIIDQLQLKVERSSDGTFYFDSGRGKLYFGHNNGTFYFYSVEGKDPYLRTMLTALPQFPMAYRQYLQWQEYLPISLVTQGGLKALVQFIVSFYHNLAGVEAKYSCTTENNVSGIIQTRFPKMKIETRVEWDEQIGFTRFKVGDLELRKCVSHHSGKSSKFNSKFDKILEK